MEIKEFEKTEFYQDNYIYKYITINERALKILINSELYFGIPHDQNDPFEGEFVLSKAVPFKDKNALKKFLKEDCKLDEIEIAYFVNLNPNSNEINKEVVSYVRRKAGETYGVSCFSKKPDKITMWSHYADSHKGLCLIFDSNILLESMNQLGNLYLNEIEYTKNLPLIEPKLIEEGISFLGIEKIYTIKTESWSYEEEVRILCQLIQSNSRTTHFESKALKGIIFGTNMNIDDVKTILNLINGNPKYNLTFYKAEKNNEEAKIHIKFMQNSSLYQGASTTFDKFGKVQIRTGG